ncbi:sulfite exporter TauE/SafE family protein [Nocardioides dubius]|uniref:Probable membrane transporter protein n=1 Tax=Nocardioides dubius TaxID=317019 RepID=A0ABN1TVA7_9ACTN
MELIELFALGFAVYVVASAVQAAVGFGMTVVAVPVLIPLVGAVPAVVSSVLVSLALCGRVWWRERAHVDTVLTRRLSLPALLGLPAGAALLLAVSERQLALLVAAAMLLGVIVVAAVERPRIGPFGQRIGGLASGALLTSTGLNGPALVLTVQGTDLEPRQQRATLQAAFVVQDVVALGLFLALGQVGQTALVIGVAGALGAPLGWLIGDKVFSRLSPRRFRRAVQATLAVSALGSIYSATK